ncbi:MAG: Sua5/YciO/YrdC/YwlC family protein, partial [Patescibacteria group bacterium]
TKTPPLIAANLAMVEKQVVLSDRLREFAHLFWPGPLTIVAPIKEGSSLSPAVVREDGTVAIRVTSHLVARTLSEELNVPLVATSANVAGEETCYDITHVQNQFQTRHLQPDFYLDDGVLEKRLPSTIVAEKEGKIVVLRQGELVIPESYVA